MRAVRAWGRKSQRLGRRRDEPNVAVSEVPPFPGRYKAEGHHETWLLHAGGARPGLSWSLGRCWGGTLPADRSRKQLGSSLSFWS